MVICIDADQTIFVNNDNHNIVGVINGARDYINRLYDDGHIIVIWSSRNNLVILSDEERLNALKELEDNLSKYGIKYDWIDDGLHGKVPADLYIDDKAIRFERWDDDLIRKIEAIESILDGDTFDELYLEFLSNKTVK